jgi:ketosteroid isomerase-like protein
MDEERAIQKVITTYSQTCSIGDWDGAVDTYLPEGSWTIPHLDLCFTGHEAIRGALRAFFDTMDYVIQLNAPALIDVSGASATARSAIRECGKSAGKVEGFEYFGFYQDELTKTAVGWRFRKRVFEGVGTSMFPLIQ